MREFTSERITYKYDELTPYLVTVLYGDNEPIEVDISNYDFHDNDDIIEAVRCELEAERLNGFKDEIEWGFEFRSYKATLFIEIAEGNCSIELIQSSNVSKCIYNDKWLGYDHLIENLRYFDLEFVAEFLENQFNAE